MTWKQLSIVLPLFGLIACNNVGKPDNHEHHGAESATATPAAEKVEFTNSTLGAIHQHYIHLTTALVNGDVAEAKLASSAIEAGANQLAGGKTLATDARTILAAKGIEEQRTAFSSLSNEMIRLVKQSGIKTGNLYVEYCPMAMNDKGAYWLSNDSAIKNPYFGEKMMACGEVKEVLHK